MENDIRSFREVLRDWKQEFPGLAVREVRERLALDFTEALAAASGLNARYGPRKDTDFFDNERILADSGITDVAERERLLQLMKQSDDMLRAGRAESREERTAHLETLVSLMCCVSHLGEMTARAFVEAYFYEERPSSVKVRGWQYFAQTSLYFVFTGKHVASLRREVSNVAQ